MSVLTSENCRDYRNWMAAKCADPSCVPMTELVERVQNFIKTHPVSYGRNTFTPHEMGMSRFALQAVMNYMCNNRVPVEVDGEETYFAYVENGTAPSDSEVIQEYCRQYGRGQLVCLTEEDR